MRYGDDFDPANYGIALACVLLLVAGVIAFVALASTHSHSTTVNEAVRAACADHQRVRSIDPDLMIVVCRDGTTHYINDFR